MFIGALRGAGDTRFIMLNTSAISIVSLLTGYYFEDRFRWSETGFALYGWWWILTGWVLALGLTYLIRFEQGKWKTMRVIEPELLEVEIKPSETIAEACEVA